MEYSLIASLIALASVLGQAILALAKRAKTREDRELYDKLRDDVHRLAEEVSEIKGWLRGQRNGRLERTR